MEVPIVPIPAPVTLKNLFKKQFVNFYGANNNNNTYLTECKWENTLSLSVIIFHIYSSKKMDDQVSY